MSFSLNSILKEILEEDSGHSCNNEVLFPPLKNEDVQTSVEATIHQIFRSLKTELEQRMQTFSLVSLCIQKFGVASLFTLDKSPESISKDLTENLNVEVQKCLDKLSAFKTVADALLRQEKEQNNHLRSLFDIQHRLRKFGVQLDMNCHGTVELSCLNAKSEEFARCVRVLKNSIKRVDDSIKVAVNSIFKIQHDYLLKTFLDEAADSTSSQIKGLFTALDEACLERITFYGFHNAEEESEIDDACLRDFWNLKKKPSHFEVKKVASAQHPPLFPLTAARSPLHLPSLSPPFPAPQEERVFCVALCRVFIKKESMLVDKEHLLYTVPGPSGILPEFILCGTLVPHLASSSAHQQPEDPPPSSFYTCFNQTDEAESLAGEQGEGNDEGARADNAAEDNEAEKEKRSIMDLKLETIEAIGEAVSVLTERTLPSLHTLSRTSVINHITTLWKQTQGLVSPRSAASDVDSKLGYFSLASLHRLYLLLLLCTSLPTIPQHYRDFCQTTASDSLQTTFAAACSTSEVLTQTLVEFWQKRGITSHPPGPKAPANTLLHGNIIGQKSAYLRGNSTKDANGSGIRKRLTSVGTHTESNSILGDDSQEEEEESEEEGDEDEEIRHTDMHVDPETREKLVQMMLQLRVKASLSQPLLPTQSAAISTLESEAAPSSSEEEEEYSSAFEKEEEEEDTG